MDISSISNTASQRPVTQSKNSSDRQPNNDMQAANEQVKAQDRAQEQRAVQQRQEQRNEEKQRRLDGRLISFGEPQDQHATEQKQVSFNRSRVNEAYSPVKNESSNAQNQHTERSHERDNDAIDIVV